MFKWFRPLILVVDDEKDFADGLVKTIEAPGKYRAKAVYSAKDAFLEIERQKWLLDIPRNRIRCIILDIKMPEMDGMQFLEKLWKMRKEEYGYSEFYIIRSKTYIPVIILSAWEDEEIWKRTPGKLEYLRKPVKEEELFSALDKIIFGGPPQYSKMWDKMDWIGRKKHYLKIFYKPKAPEEKKEEPKEEKLN